MQKDLLISSMPMSQRHGVAGGLRLAPMLQSSEKQVKACIFASSSFSSEFVSLYLSQTTAADLLSWCAEEAVKLFSILLVCSQTDVKSIYPSSAFPKNCPCYSESHFMVNTMFSSNVSAFLYNCCFLDSRNSKITLLQKPGFLILSL